MSSTVGRRILSRLSEHKTTVNGLIRDTNRAAEGNAVAAVAEGSAVAAVSDGHVVDAAIDRVSYSREPARTDAPRENLIRRSARLAYKHRVRLIAGPFQPARLEQNATRFGNLMVVGTRSGKFDKAGSAQAYHSARGTLHADPAMRSMLMQLEAGTVEGGPVWKTTIHVSDGFQSEFYACRDRQLLIHWNPRQAIMPSTGHSLPPALLLGHEVAHAYHYAADPAAFIKRMDTSAGFMLNREEALTHAREVIAAKNIGVGMRKHYFDANIHFVDHPTETIAAADAPWLAEKARALAATSPPLTAFPQRSRARIERHLKKLADMTPK